MLLKRNSKEKNKWNKAQKPIKIVFWWSSKNEKSGEIGFFGRNDLTLFVSGRKKTRIFMHTICFGQNFWAQNNQNQPKL